MAYVIDRVDVDFARAASPWVLGDGVLYDLCRRHPKHDSDDEIIAKVWLADGQDTLENRGQNKEASVV